MKRSLSIIAALTILATVSGCSRNVVQHFRDDDGKTTQVNVPVQHDWLWLGDTPYKLDADVTNASLRKDEISLKVLKDIGLTTSPETVLETSAKVRFKDGKGRASFDIGSLEPGFYQVSVGGCEPFNIGIRPEEIVSPQDKQPDFDEFWDSTLRELAGVDPEYSLTLLPEKSNSQRNVYRVEFKSLCGALYSTPLPNRRPSSSSSACADRGYSSGPQPATGTYRALKARRLTIIAVLMPTSCAP